MLPIRYCLPLNKLYRMKHLAKPKKPLSIERLCLLLTILCSKAHLRYSFQLSLWPLKQNICFLFLILFFPLVFTGLRNTQVDKGTIARSPVSAKSIKKYIMLCLLIVTVFCNIFMYSYLIQILKFIYPVLDRNRPIRKTQAQDRYSCPIKSQIKSFSHTFCLRHQLMGTVKLIWRIKTRSMVLSTRSQQGSRIIRCYYYTFQIQAL